MKGSAAFRPHVLLVALLALAFCGLKPTLLLASPCDALITLSPSLTEAVYALGLGDSVRGVSSFSNYPEGATKKPVVGGLLDLSPERVLSLAPSVVFGLNEHRQVLRELGRLGLRTEGFDHRNVKGILASLTAIGQICQIDARAAELRAEIEGGIKRVFDRSRKLVPVRTMIIVGDGESLSGNGSFILSGKDGFYSDLLELAGGRNVLEGGTVMLPAVSGEGIITLAPEVILEVMPARDAGEEEKLLRARLSALPEVPAVRTGRVHVLGQDFAVVPGPRLVVLLELIFRLLHPETA